MLSKIVIKDAILTDFIGIRNYAIITIILGLKNIRKLIQSIFQKIYSNP